MSHRSVAWYSFFSFIQYLEFKGFSLIPSMDFYDPDLRGFGMGLAL
jgi:hypothetical protein